MTSLLIPHLSVDPANGRIGEAILRILDSEAAVVGTIVLRPQPFADRVKAHPRVRLRTITRDNRDELPGEIVAELARRGLSRQPPCPRSCFVIK